jgi:hypothetical protein
LELIYGAPHPGLRADVLSYCGYAERTGGPARRRELPWPGVVLIFDFGPTLRILDPFDETMAGTHAAGFVAGLHDICALTETSGAQSGVQVNLTPLGARQLTGVPMAELANRVVSIEDVLGAAGRQLTAALHDAPGWAARFDLLDAIIGRRVETAAAASPLARRRLAPARGDQRPARDRCAGGGARVQPQASDHDLSRSDRLGAEDGRARAALSACDPAA